MEISKELLSEVLGYEALPTQVSTKELQYIDKRRKHGAFHPCRINIYELSHRCKEWAHNKGYMLNTVILTADNKTWYCEDDYRKTRTTWKDDSEPLVIFKACEWILNNKPL